MTATLYPPQHRPDARRASRGWQELVVDNFAGGGGASLGLERGLGRAVDVSINHDPDAVEMHRINHPASKHVCESVWEFDPIADLVKWFGSGRFTFGVDGRITAGIGLAWFSPDCRHFSLAKGGKPVSKRVRGLAWVVVKWAKLVRPRVVLLENVREFEQWGPLAQAVGTDGVGLTDAAGRPVLMPCRDRRGQTFRRWVGQLRRLGYVVEWRLLDAADYGAPTHRRRLFLVARCDGRPIVWPERTHGDEKDARKSLRSGKSLSGGDPTSAHYGPEGACDARAESDRCGNRRNYREGRSGSESLWKGVQGRSGKAKGARRTLKPYRTAAECIDWSIPCPSIFDRKRPLAEKTLRRIALGLKRYVLDNPRPFIVKINHGRDEFRGQGLSEPLSTITSSHGHAVVTPFLTQMQNGSNLNGSRSVDRPTHTVTSYPKGGGVAVVAPSLVQIGYGEAPGKSPRTLDIEEPLGTVVGGGQKHALVTAFLAKHYGGVVGHGVEQPIGTVTSVDHHGLVAAHITRMNHGDKQWQAVDEPIGTVTSQGNKFGIVYAFMTKYFGTAVGHHLDEPMHTVTGRDRFGVVTVQIDGQTYAIADIGMRMLSPRELARAQGFPDSYVLTGSKANQVHKIGNSVCPVMAEAMVRANHTEEFA